MEILVGMRRVGLVGLLVLAAACTSEVSGTGTVSPSTSSDAAPDTSDPPPRRVAANLRFAAVRAEEPQPCDTEDATHTTDTKVGSCLVLDPADSFITQAVAASAAVPSGQTQWAITVRLDDEAAGRFETLTGRVAQNPPPGNRIAIVDVEHGMLSAPAVTSAISGPEVQISGDFTKDEAEDLADRLAGS